MSVFSIVPVEVCLDDRLTKMQLRVLIALFSFRNKTTNTCFPKRKALSERCGYTEQTISKVTKQLVDMGWLKKQGLGGFSSPCTYLITVPEPDTVSKVDTVSKPAKSTVSESATTTVSGLDTRKEQTNEHTKEQTSVPRKGSMITVDQFIANCRSNGEKLIPDNDPIFDDCDKSGIPHDYLLLNWKVFVRAYRESGKKQKDWRATFRNSVRARWYSLWWFDNNNVCQLTSNGKQAQMEFSHE